MFTSSSSDFFPDGAMHKLLCSSHIQALRAYFYQQQAENPSKHDAETKLPTGMTINTRV